MPDAQTTPHPAEHDRRIELGIIYLLTNPSANQPLWALEDLAREIDESDITTYIRPLRDAGLIHQTADGHVFPSRAAVRLVQIVGHNVF